MLPKLPDKAVRVLEAIQNAGGYGFVVGGALRDMMLGKTPADWDFAATLSPERLRVAFPQATPIGGEFGTLQVPFGEGTCEVTPCRIESRYSDRRHPDQVRFVPNILADLARRDFTINAMAYDGQILLDPYGGQKDLRAKMIRCVGNPTQRFEEDPLRILRMFRFCATLGFTAEWNTVSAASELMDLVATLSRERVREELGQILLSDGPQVLSHLIAKGGLCRYGFAFAPSLAALSEVPREAICRWWALMALCGADPDMAGEALGFSRRFLSDLAEINRLYRCGPARDKVALKQKLRNTRLDYAPLSASFAAVSPAFTGEPVLFAAIRIKKEPYRLSDLVVSGDMLRYEGIYGEHCGAVLDELLKTVIKNPKLNRVPVLLGLARGLKELL